MIVNCKNGSNEQIAYKVKWGRDFSHVTKEKIIVTFQKANGFASSLQKRGMFVQRLEEIKS